MPTIFLSAAITGQPISCGSLGADDQFVALGDRHDARAAVEGEIGIFRAVGPGPAGPMPSFIGSPVGTHGAPADLKPCTPATLISSRATSSGEHKCHDHAGA